MMPDVEVIKHDTPTPVMSRPVTEPGVVFNAVVIAEDPDSGPNRATPVGSALADRGGLPLEVVSVVAGQQERSGFEARRPAAAQAPNARWSVIASGDVASGIAEHLQSRCGALLVMATSGVGLISRSRTSVVARVMSELRQPVLLIGPAVADGARLDHATMVLATSAGQDAGGAIAVVRAWHQTFGGERPWVVDVAPASGWPTEAIGTTKDRDRVDAVACELSGVGVDTATMVLRGDDPAGCLVDFARPVGNAVFVVTSDRWAGGSSPWYSTARRLVQRSPRPVLVVPADLADW